MRTLSPSEVGGMSDHGLHVLHTEGLVSGVNVVCITSDTPVLTLRRQAQDAALERHGHCDRHLGLTGEPLPQQLAKARCERVSGALPEEVARVCDQRVVPARNSVDQNQAINALQRADGLQAQAHEPVGDIAVVVATRACVQT
mgnify:CR=1 FL=1